MRRDGTAITGDILEVFFEETLVGRIERGSEMVTDIAFTYADGWAGTPGAFPVSLTMPMEDKVIDRQTTYSWLMNLLPDEDALKLVSARLGVDDLDVFAMLATMGADVAGALRIVPPGNKKGEKPGYLKLTEEQFHDCLARLPERPLLAGEDDIHMSAAGAQDKLPVALYKDGTVALPLNGAASTHIVKPRSPRFWGSVPNEGYCLALARAVKLDAAWARPGRAGDIDYLLIKRYDRIMDGRMAKRIHQEDLCQAAGYPPFLKYEWNQNANRPGPSTKTCMDVFAKTPAPGLNRLRFFDLMLFNVLVGNVDAHSKNYSLIIRDRGNILLAPLYDSMNGEIYDGVTRNLAMKIAKKQRAWHVHGRHWDRFAAESDLSAIRVRRRVAALAKAMLKAAPEVAAAMANDHGSDPIYARISEHVMETCRRMLANLDTDPAPQDDIEDEDLKGVFTAR